MGNGSGFLVIVLTYTTPVRNTWVMCDTVLPDKRRIYWLLQKFL